VPGQQSEARCPMNSATVSASAEPKATADITGRPPKAALMWSKNLKSRASRLAKPDARHHGGRRAADPAHKPASRVDAVRVPHGRRESAGGLSKDHDSSAGVVFVGAAGDGGGAGGWNEAAPQPQCQPGQGARHEPASQVQ